MYNSRYLTKNQITSIDAGTVVVEVVLDPSYTHELVCGTEVGGQKHEITLMENISGIVSGLYEDRWCKQGSTAIFTCEVDAPSGSDTITYVIDGVNATVTDSLTQEINTTELGRFEYSCWNKDQVMGDIITITVGSSALEMLSTEQVTTGGSVSLQCTAPLGTTVTFKKVGELNLDLSSFTNSVSDENLVTSTFLLPSLVSSYSGFYYCDSDNGRTSAVQILQLNPITEVQDVAVGDTVTLVVEGIAPSGIALSAGDGTDTSANIDRYETSDGNTMYVGTVSSAGRYNWMDSEGGVVGEVGIAYGLTVNATAPRYYTAGQEVQVRCDVKGIQATVAVSVTEEYSTVLEYPDGILDKVAARETISYSSSLKLPVGEQSVDVTCSATGSALAVQDTVVVGFIGFLESVDDQTMTVGDTMQLTAAVCGPDDETFSVSLQIIDGDDEGDQYAFGEGTGCLNISSTFSITKSRSSLLQLLLDTSQGDATSNTFSLTVYDDLTDSTEKSINYPGIGTETVKIACRIVYASPLALGWAITQDGYTTYLSADSPYVQNVFTDLSGVTESVVEFTITDHVENDTFSAGCYINYDSSSRGIYHYTFTVQNYRLALSDESAAWMSSSSHSLYEVGPYTNSTVFYPDGTPLTDLTSAFLSSDITTLTSLVEWEAGAITSHYQISTDVKLAGVEVVAHDTDTLIPGANVQLTCYAYTTDKLNVNTVYWTANFENGTETISVDTAPSTINYYTVSLPNTTGESVEVECTVQYGYTDNTVSNHTSSFQLITQQGCYIPPVLQDGSISATSLILYPAEKVTVTCNNGYQLNGASQYTCDGSTGLIWDSAPSCVSLASSLCPAVAPENHRISYSNDELSLNCAGEDYARFRGSQPVECSPNQGWVINGDQSTSVKNLKVCGEMVVPISKEVGAAVTYNSGTQYCASTNEENNAYAAFLNETSLDQNSKLELELDSCTPTATGYVLQCYTVKRLYLSIYLQTENSVCPIYSECRLASCHGKKVIVVIVVSPLPYLQSF
eukprot:sb/3461558/